MLLFCQMKNLLYTIFHLFPSNSDIFRKFNLTFIYEHKKLNTFANLKYINVPNMYFCILYFIVDNYISINRADFYAICLAS